ncbi:MAG: glycine-rich domain-containing protein-like [Oxalobacteraceae bacterium]|nr:MAG: glycine-rich domain-containing protein-like [Oxalobacteraceae bacterium]
MDTKTADQFRAIMELDLVPIKVKLMHVESGEAWSLEKANAVEKEYRRFLCLMKMFPEEDTAPSVDVDTFWHYHILDTMKYARDCERAFGYFLHHYPYVGLRGEDDERFRLDSGERMRTLYEATFGEDYPVSIGADAAYCAGPGAKMAYCAGPGAKIAYCAGPGAKPIHCAAPVATAAYCAGPGIKPAYCAGPGAKAAYLAGPALDHAAHTLS